MIAPGTQPPADPHPCAEPSLVEARYLLTILDLARGGGPPTQAAVARALGVSGPSALEMVRRLRRLGFVHDGGLTLTPAGMSAALVLSSRRAAARALVHDVLGVDDAIAAREADLIAGSVSPALGRRLWRDARGRSH